MAAAGTGDEPLQPLIDLLTGKKESGSCLPWTV